ncbi:MAG TPA: hypothetical protein VK914_05985 [bacterium]|jgi:hypothetical protein|nr:hypothetical protein [bacterium]
MALRLQFLALVVPRERFKGCRGLPQFLDHLNPGSGVFFETAWYDRRLFCETAMSAGDAEGLAAKWVEAGLAPSDLCLAASRRGPLEACAWLDYSMDDDCVWMKGTEKGEIVGGAAQIDEKRRGLGILEAAGEKAYAAMYDSRHPKDDFDDAHAALAGALELARFLHRPDAVERLGARIAHIESVYKAQFRGF